MCSCEKFIISTTVFLEDLGSCCSRSKMSWKLALYFSVKLGALVWLSCHCPWFCADAEHKNCPVSEPRADYHLLFYSACKGFARSCTLKSMAIPFCLLHSRCANDFSHLFNRLTMASGKRCLLRYNQPNKCVSK